MTQLLQNAVYGTVMILAVAGLRGALKDRLLPEARLALWAACLFRLFTPIAPTSALSFWGLFGREAREIPLPVPVPGPAAAPGAGIIAPAAPNVTAPAAPEAAGAGVPWGAILAAVWIAVGAILAARYALAYVRTRRAVGRAIPLGREDARYAALPKCARLREGPMDGAPLTFGVARPTVVLTPGLDGTELACVLAHEGVHARRRDNLWHYAAAAALTVFWWDPAVWLMARLIRRDVELSCDRAAVRRLGEGRRAEYAAALVTLSTQAEGGAFCHGFGPKRTEERIVSIMKYKKATIAGIALTLALVLAVTVGFASNPTKDVPDEEGAVSSVMPDGESTASSAPATLMWMCCSDPENGGKVLSGSISIDYLELLLADCVAGGSMTEENAAYYLAAAEAMSRDGVNLDWKAPRDIELFTDGAEHRERGQIGPYVYYMDGNGNKVCLNPVEMLAAFVFAPGDADASGSNADAGGQDEMYICIREDCGNNGVHEHDGVMYKAWIGKISMPAPGICTREDCDVSGPHWHENGKVIHCLPADVVVDDLLSYNDLVLPAYIGDQEQDEALLCTLPVPPLCTQEDCDISGAHYHSEDGEVVHYYNPLPAALDLPERGIDQSGYTWEEMEKFYMTPDEYAAKVEEYRAMLQAAVDKGLITQEEMDLSIADAVSQIGRVRSGEMVPLYVEYGEGERQDGLTFTFGYENADYVGSTSVMRRVPIN